MSWSSRAFETTADLRLMQALTSDCWRFDWPAPSVHPGDLDWWSRDSVSGAVPLSERVRLWFEAEVDDSALVAWAWFGLPGDLDLLVRPDLRGSDLTAAILDWAVPGRSRWPARRRPRRCDPDTRRDPGVRARFPAALIEQLGRLGFEGVPGGLMVGFTRSYEGWIVPEPELPPGFMSRTLSPSDIESRIATGRLAFPNSRMTAERYEVARRSTLYRSALDRLIIAPDGSVAALALGWLDPVTLALELEPVAVHPAGTGVVSAEPSAWPRSGAGIGLGATHGLIFAEGSNTAALGLYASLGYEITTWIRPYRRALSG